MHAYLPTLFSRALLQFETIDFASPLSAYLLRAVHSASLLRCCSRRFRFFFGLDAAGRCFGMLLISSTDVCWATAREGIREFSGNGSSGCGNVRIPFGLRNVFLLKGDLRFFVYRGDPGNAGRRIFLDILQ